MRTFQYLTTLFFVSTASLAAAWPTLGNFDSLASRAKADPHLFQPVPEGGVRSPCPATNTLANHGYINRDGKGITQKAYQLGFQNMFNIQTNVTLTGVTRIFHICAEATGARCETLDLDMLAIPHEMEHDASLSRQDKKMATDANADNNGFNSTIWNMTLDIFGDVTHLDVSLANTAIMRRLEQAATMDFPGWFVNTTHSGLSEAARYLAVFNDPTVPGVDRMVNPLARLDWVHYWFVNERLPTALGWARATSRIVDFDGLLTIVAAAPTIPASSAAATSSITTVSGSASVTDMVTSASSMPATTTAVLSSLPDTTATATA